jgi:hypothetical protein
VDNLLLPASGSLPANPHLPILIYSILKGLSHAIWIQENFKDPASGSLPANPHLQTFRYFKGTVSCDSNSSKFKEYSSSSSFIIQQPDDQPEVLQHFNYFFSTKRRIKT